MSSISPNNTPAWWSRGDRTQPADKKFLGAPSGRLRLRTDVQVSSESVGDVPSNTQADLRDAFTAAGFDRVTSHVFRKTVATLMDQAGLSSRAAADQLGHANTSMTTDVYFGRKVAATGTAAVLEALNHLP